MNPTTKAIEDYNNLELREATNDVKLETTFCHHCGFNSYDNIGQYECAKCGIDKRE